VVSTLSGADYTLPKMTHPSMHAASAGDNKNKNKNIIDILEI
jgi:hypothetical protein